MAKLNNVEIHFKHSNRTYNTMTAFLVMLGFPYMFLGLLTPMTPLLEYISS